MTLRANFVRNPWGKAVLLFLLLLAACGPTASATVPRTSPTAAPAAPSATPPPASATVPTAQPWPTRTPQQPVTRPPRPTVPTRTPVPPPTAGPPPPPFFPPQAAVPEGWPSLPADLYFLRAGQLWRWAAGDAQPQRLAPAEGSAEEVVHYRLTPAGDTIAYQTAAGQLYVIERNGLIHRPIPTVGQLSTILQDGTAQAPNGELLSGDVLAITPDGQYVLYLAWGVRPANEGAASGRAAALAAPPQQGVDYATIYAAEIVRPENRHPLGFCEPGVAGQTRIPVNCSGFVLSPDGRQIAFSEASGLWQTDVPAGNPQLLAAHRDDLCSVLLPRQWSPDNQTLLADLQCSQGAALAVVNTYSGRVQTVPNTRCDDDCFHSGAWTEEGLWVAQNGFAQGEGYTWRAGTLRRFEFDADDALRLTRLLARSDASGLVHPWSPAALPERADLILAFAHQPCPGSPDAQTPGVYFFNRYGGVVRVADLPSPGCCAAEAQQAWFCPGILYWTADGTVFLYRESQSQSALVGLTGEPALWNVQDLLQGAEQFTWGE